MYPRITDCSDGREPASIVSSIVERRPRYGVFVLSAAEICDITAFINSLAVTSLAHFTTFQILSKKSVTYIALCG